MKELKEFNDNVHYMEDFDFDKKGNLINKQIPTDMLVLIMIQASWCKFCKDSKPAFQDFANQMSKNVFCGTIQENGHKKPKSEIPLGKRLKKIIPDFNGFPDYALYKNGKIINVKTTDRDVNSLKKFCEPHILKTNVIRK